VQTIYFYLVKIKGFISEAGICSACRAPLWVCIFLAPIMELLVVTGFFILADFAAGVWRSCKLEGYRSIRSNKMWNTVTKMVLYLLGVVVAYVADVYIITDQIPFLEIITGFICMTELKSIYENIGEATGVDIWTHIRKYIDGKRNSK